MPDSRTKIHPTPEKPMTALALKARESIDAAIFGVVDALPAKPIALATGVKERKILALKYREGRPNTDEHARFGFAYPSVAQVIAYWADKMLQADFFDPETQREFYRDYFRAGSAA